MSRGHDRERAVQRRLEEDDWVVTRAAGSLGIYDLHASKNGRRTCLVEVKSTAQGPYERFGPSHRADLEAVARRADAVAVLAWWPPHGKLTWIFSSEWPDARVVKLVETA